MSAVKIQCGYSHLWCPSLQGYPKWDKCFVHWEEIKCCSVHLNVTATIKFSLKLKQFVFIKMLGYSVYLAALWYVV